MIRRTLNPDDLRIATSQLEIPVDIDQWVLLDSNVGLIDERGNVALFVGESVGKTYNGHIFFRDTGRKAVEAAPAFLDEIFYNYDASVILGLTPEDKRHVILFNRRLGFKDVGTVETTSGLYRMLIMARQDWINNE